MGRVKAIIAAHRERFLTEFGEFLVEFMRRFGASGEE